MVNIITWQLSIQCIRAYECKEKRTNDNRAKRCVGRFCCIQNTLIFGRPRAYRNITKLNLN